MSIPLAQSLDDPLNSQQKESLENGSIKHSVFANRYYFVIGASVALGLFCLKKSLGK